MNCGRLTLKNYLLPVTDCTLTRICHAVNIWTFPYINSGVSFPLMAVIEGSENVLTVVLDPLMTEICFRLACKTLPTFFKNPKKEILDIGHAIE